jgi:hypothetical protein
MMRIFLFFEYSGTTCTRLSDGNLPVRKMRRQVRLRLSIKKVRLSFHLFLGITAE